jgi:hypothetical protein
MRSKPASPNTAQMVPGVEPLGVKLVVYDPGCVVDDQFAGNDAIAIRAQFALPADQVLIVDPFPASPIQVCAEPGRQPAHPSRRRQTSGKGKILLDSVTRIS